MDILIIVLRLVHVFAGVFWAGTAFFFVSFLEPAVEAAGADGAKFMQKLTLSRFPTALPMLAIVTVLSGLWLYWLKSGGLQIAWITSSPGLGFTFGGIAGLAALVVGLIVSAPASRRMQEIARGLVAAGGPPSPDQMTEIQHLSERLSKGAIWTAALLALAVAGMAVARSL